MPTYEYLCKSCGHNFDVVQAFTEDALRSCPECEGPLKKVFGSVGITFKGSGFYKTDSRSGSTSTASGGASSGGSSSKPDSSGSSDGGSSGSGASSDAKPAATSGSAPSSGTGSS